MLCVRAGAGFQKIEDARIVYRMIGWMRKSSGGMLAINEWVAKVDLKSVEENRTIVRLMYHDAQDNPG